MSTLGWTVAATDHGPLTRVTGMSIMANVVVMKRVVDILNGKEVRGTSPSYTQAVRSGPLFFSTWMS